MGAVYYTRILKTLIFEERPSHLPQVEEAPFSMRLGLLVRHDIRLKAGLPPYFADVLARELSTAISAADGEADASPPSSAR